MTESKFVSREELYEQVWSTPTQHLAAEYGISDVALGKICKKLSVPKPPPGYWAQVAAAYGPRKPRLPKARPGQQSGVIIEPSAVSEKSELDSQTTALLESISQLEITVPEVLDRPHILIRAARKHLRGRKPDKYGRVWPTEPCIDISIAKASLNRGLLILNTMFRELEALGYRAFISSTSRTVLDKGGTELTIALEERSRRNENPPPKKDASWWTSFDKYSFEPTGDLEIILGRWPIGESRWRDTPVRPLETRIRDILIKIVKSTCLVQQAQVKRAQEDELRRQRAREAEEQRRIEIEEQRRRQTLADNAADWNNAEQLRRFISVVEIVLQGEPALAPRQIDKWIEWAKKCADRTDPITNGKLVQQVEVLGRTS